MVKEVRAVQSFLSCRGLVGRLGFAVALPATLLAAVPARAASFDSAMDDARDIAVTTGHGIAAFAGRIGAGDMMAIKAAVFGFAALIAFIGLWLLLSRVPRDEAVIIAIDETEQEPLILTPPAYTPAQPALSPAFRGDTRRPVRLLEAVAAARAHYEIAVAERHGHTLV